MKLKKKAQPPGKRPLIPKPVPQPEETAEAAEHAIELLQQRIDLIRRDWPNDPDMRDYGDALYIAICALKREAGIDE